QTETEATGAPQKHHYTLNQQVGSITWLTVALFLLIQAMRYKRWPFSHQHLPGLRIPGLFQW
ncbi:hypothetical protein QML22_05425, partial [Klebsiella pneumoniae]